MGHGVLRVKNFASLTAPLLRARAGQSDAYSSSSFLIRSIAFFQLSYSTVRLSSTSHVKAFKVGAGNVQINLVAFPRDATESPYRQLSAVPALLVAFLALAMMRPGVAERRLTAALHWHCGLPSLYSDLSA